MERKQLNMFNIIVYLGCACLRVLTAVNLHTSDSTVNFNISDENECQDVNVSIRFYFHLSLHDCVKQCGLREDCSRVQYNGPTSLCMIFTDRIEPIFANRNGSKCVHVERKNIEKIQVPCNVSCQSGAVCDKIIRECKIQDCPQPRKLSNGKILGNGRNVGNKIRYLCDSGYKETRGIKSSVCREDGTWSEVPECIQDRNNSHMVTTVSADLDTTKSTSPPSPTTSQTTSVSSNADMTKLTSSRSQKSSQTTPVTSNTDATISRSPSAPTTSQTTPVSSNADTTKITSPPSPKSSQTTPLSSDSDTTKLTMAKSDSGTPSTLPLASFRTTQVSTYSGTKSEMSKPPPLF